MHKSGILKIKGRPTEMPVLPEGSLLVCRLIRAIGIPSLNSVVICETLEDMQKLYDIHYSGGALLIDWYILDMLSPEEVEVWLSGGTVQ